MKYFFLLCLATTLAACDQAAQNSRDSKKDAYDILSAPEEMPAEPLIEINGSQFEIDQIEALPNLLELKSSDTTIILDNFKERQRIESPLKITGLAPRSWFFEGSFPVTLMTLEEVVVKEWYASGPWLEGINGDEELKAEDLIAFEALIEFEVPSENADLGKIRFSKSLVADEDQADFVEALILWP